MNDIQPLIEKMTALATQHPTRAMIADALMAETEITYVRVPLDVLEQYLLVNGLHQSLRSHAVAGSGASHQAAAIIMMMITSGRMTNVDVHHPMFDGGLEALLSASVLTAAQRDTIIALGTRNDLVVNRYGVNRQYLLDIMASYGIGV